MLSGEDGMSDPSYEMDDPYDPDADAVDPASYGAGPSDDMQDPGGEPDMYGEPGMGGEADPLDGSGMYSDSGYDVGESVDGEEDVDDMATDQQDAGGLYAGQNQPIAQPDLPLDLAQQGASPAVLDAALLAATATPNDLSPSMGQYVDSFEQAVSGLGRALVEARSDAYAQRSRMGDGPFSAQMSRMESTFRAMGDMALAARQQALASNVHTQSELGVR